MKNLGLNRVPNFAEYRVPSILDRFCRVPSTDIDYLTKRKYFFCINFMNN